jgi:hypothetical protein
MIWQHRRKTPPQANSGNWLIDHLKGNFISSVSILVMTVGLTTIYSYHFHIEYFPQIGIESFTSIIFATTYVGTLLLIGFGVVLFAPSLFIGTVWQAANRKNNRDQRQRRLHLVALLGAAILAFIILPPFLLLSLQLPISAGFSLLIFVSFCGLTLILIGLIWLRKKGLAKPASERRANLWAAAKFAWPYGCILILQIFPIAMFLLIIRDSSYLAPENPDYYTFAESMVICCILFLAINFYFIINWFEKSENNLEKSFALGGMLVFPLVSSFFLGNVSFFSATIARVTKVGNFYASEMTLSGAGCAVLAKQGVLTCPDKPETPFKLCGAYVMSRFGGETYIKVNFAQAGKPPGKRAKGASKLPDSSEEGITKLENVYLPTAAILGMKVDTSVQATNISKIDNNLKGLTSICPAEKAALKSGPYSFKATELFDHAQSTLSSCEWLLKTA